MVSVCRARWRRLAQVAGHSARVHGPRQGRVACSDGQTNSLDDETQTVLKMQTMAHDNEKLLKQMRRAGWVTVAEAAKMTTRSTSTIYYWIKRGYVGTCCRGRTVFVERAWMTADATVRACVDAKLAGGAP